MQICFVGSSTSLLICLTRYLTLAPSFSLTLSDSDLHWAWVKLCSSDLLMYIMSIQKFTVAFYLVLTSDFGNFIARIAFIIHWILFYSHGEEYYSCGRYFLEIELIHTNVSTREIKCVMNYSWCLNVFSFSVALIYIDL